MIFSYSRNTKCLKYNTINIALAVWINHIIKTGTICVRFDYGFIVPILISATRPCRHLWVIGQSTSCPPASYKSKNHLLHPFFPVKTLKVSLTQKAPEADIFTGNVSYRTGWLFSTWLQEHTSCHPGADVYTSSDIFRAFSLLHVTKLPSDHPFPQIQTPYTHPKQFQGIH